MCPIEVEADEAAVVAASPDFLGKPPRKPRKQPGPIKPGQHLLFRSQILELTGTSTVTLWGWMADANFPLPLELGPPGGRSTKVAWLADEVYAWIASRPRRKIGELRRKKPEPEVPPEPRQQRRKPKRAAR